MLFAAAVCLEGIADATSVYCRSSTTERRRMASAAPKTDFGSLRRYVKGAVEALADDPRRYAFSNVFEVAAESRPYEKVVVAKHVRYVMEVLRAEGASPWFTAAHDEFALVMDGHIEIELRTADGRAPPIGVEGSLRLDGDAPCGALMGRVFLRRGHQALLPARSAYRFRAGADVGVIVLQTMLGAHSVQRWPQICAT
jgi:hypothetical protein